MDLKQRIAELVIQRLELEGHTPQTFPMDAPLFAPKPDGFGFDSLAGLEIMMALSEAFGDPFADVGRADLATITTLEAYVRRKGVS